MVEYDHGDDVFWKHGSINCKYDHVDIPILLFGGLEDRYKSAMFRMIRYLNSESKLIIGPWTHDWPDVSIAWPQINFLELCLNWFNKHLKLCDEYDTTLPNVQLYVRNSFKPDQIRLTNNLGSFIDLDEHDKEFNDKRWIFDQLSDETFESIGKLYFGDSHQLKSEKVEVRNKSILLRSDFKHGDNLGVICSYGSVADSSNDQKPTLENSVTYYTS